MFTRILGIALVLALSLSLSTVYAGQSMSAEQCKSEMQSIQVKMDKLKQDYFDAKKQLGQQTSSQLKALGIVNLSSSDETKAARKKIVVNAKKQEADLFAKYNQQKDLLKQQYRAAKKAKQQAKKAAYKGKSK